jgi:hypothetical protein
MKHPQESPELLAFHGLDPELGKRSKNAHIALTIALTLMLLPVGYLVLGMLMAALYGATGGTGWFILILAVSGLKILVWCELCLLFFKPNNPWWQRFVWSSCCLLGIILTPLSFYGTCYGFVHGIGFLGIALPFVLTLSLFCIAQGYIHAHRAHASIKRITRLREASCPQPLNKPPRSPPTP